MKEIQLEKITNLVQFPSSKNYPLEPSGAYDPNDPLEDLLNEFSHLPNEDDVQLCREDLEEELHLSASPKKLGRLDRVVLISKQLKTLEDTTKRMSFLIDEIENFLPKKIRK